MSSHDGYFKIKVDLSLIEENNKEELFDDFIKECCRKNEDIHFYFPWLEMLSSQNTDVRVDVFTDVVNNRTEKLLDEIIERFPSITMEVSVHTVCIMADAIEDNLEISYKDQIKSREHTIYEPVDNEPLDGFGNDTWLSKFLRWF